MPSSQTAVSEELAQIDLALRSNATVTVDLAKSFVARHPGNADGFIFLGRAHQVRAQFIEMLDAAQRALAISPDNPLCRVLEMEALFRCGRSEEAFSTARKLEAGGKFDPMILDQLGNFYSQTNRYADAKRCYERLMVLTPTNQHVASRLAAAHAALGEVDKAERLLDGMIRKSPQEYDAYYNRAMLRKQTRDRNHIPEIEKVLAEPFESNTAEQVLCYALAKELEDLREWRRSFAALKRGADVKRRSLGYRVEDDLDYFTALTEAFNEAFVGRKVPGYEERSPIFIVGLPRSGTTLLDRILSSHSLVGSVGESDDFRVTVARHTGGQQEDGNISYSGVSALDFETIGREYCTSVEGLLPGYPHILDKTPLNYCHVGAIATALPRAKILCLRRNPMASCYATYKTLFRSGYPFTYNLEELGRYYIGFSGLMDHWHRVLPGRVLDVQYEDIVANQERVSREVISFCGLAWEEGCLNFEKNDSPSLTASVAQVRQPIYSSSIDQWRNYEEELAPLAQIFKAHGISID
jgi:tetratricopeptide (TPR) repeat protein